MPGRGDNQRNKLEGVLLNVVRIERVMVGRGIARLDIGYRESWANRWHTRMLIAATGAQRIQAIGRLPTVDEISRGCPVIDGEFVFLELFPRLGIARHHGQKRHFALGRRWRCSGRWLVMRALGCPV